MLLLQVLQNDIADIFEENVDGVILGACRDMTGICSNYGPKGAERLEYQRSVLGIKNTDVFIAQYNYQKLQSEMENIASPKWRKLQRIF